MNVESSKNSGKDKITDLSSSAVTDTSFFSQRYLNPGCRRAVLKEAIQVRSRTAKKQEAIQLKSKKPYR
ncbi:hypothetical protein MSLAZ_0957 [Methanosarcina lacustris Z-7289]|uniref:Uncharacterized protein n=1 Tax=Methanosarcina lacustris Z-7289 TaxID=1434111 RepID=A0A0E3S5M3_9EURY|nr:hypothetical protein MSLAZ_0957 [Methanosarcina lacustris Z-7289]